MQLCSKTQLQSHVPVPGVKSGGGIEPMMDLAQIAEASSKLSLMLEQVLNYVDDVLAGKQPPDNQVSVFLYYCYKSNIINLNCFRLVELSWTWYIQYQR